MTVAVVMRVPMATSVMRMTMSITVKKNYSQLQGYGFGIFVPEPEFAKGRSQIQQKVGSGVGIGERLAPEPLFKVPVELEHAKKKQFKESYLFIDVYHNLRGTELAK